MILGVTLRVALSATTPRSASLHCGVFAAIANASLASWVLRLTFPKFETLKKLYPEKRQENALFIVFHAL